VAYNSIVPTPFYHLSVAEDLLDHPDLPAGARALLHDQRGAFLFGNTAPDVQVISGQARQETHFFDLPLRQVKLPPWEEILLKYPILGKVERTPPAQAAFLTGYLCHLQADWLWVKDIFVPVFGLRSAWENFPRRLYLHNVLRSYLDRQITHGLTNGTFTYMSRAEPAGWLPFVRDEHLRQWRETLTDQLKPQAATQTVEVFAARQGIPPGEFYRMIDSEEEMDREIFSHIHREALDDYRSALLDHSIQLISTFLQRREQPSL
jgi:hypothetical protein